MNFVCKSCVQAYRAGSFVTVPGLVLHKFGPRTITTLPRLLEEIRRQGYAVDDEECRPGWRCVGAPIFDQLGRTTVAICLTGTVAELDDSKIPSIAVVVKETAQRISRQLALENIQFAM